MSTPRRISFKEALQKAHTELTQAIQSLFGQINIEMADIREMPTNAIAAEA
jgi:hypothetical protein